MSVKPLAAALAAMLAAALPNQAWPQQTGLAKAHRIAHAHALQPGQSVSLHSGDLIGQLLLQGEGVERLQVFASDGSALYVQQPLHALGSARVAVAVPAFAVRVWRIRNDGNQTVHFDAVVQQFPRLSPADAWKSPVIGQAHARARREPDAIAHATQAGGDWIDFGAVDAHDAIVEVFRPLRTMPAPLRRNSALEVEIDHVLQDAGIPSLPIRDETPMRIAGCSEPMVKVALHRIRLQHGDAKIRVRTEPGTWVRLIRALPNTAADVLDEWQRENEFAPGMRTGDDASYMRSLEALPLPSANRHMLEHSFPVELSLQQARMQTLRVHPRYSAEMDEAASAVPRAAITRTFQWLAPGAQARWLPRDADRPSLLDLSVLHPDGGDGMPIPLELQAGKHAIPLVFENGPDTRPRNTAPADPGFAFAQSRGDALPVIDAARARLRLDAHASGVLRNLDQTRGVWVALEQRVAAAPSIDAATALPTQIAWLRSAITSTDSSLQPGGTREMAAVVALVKRRQRDFIDQSCVSGDIAADANASLQALAVADAAQDDPRLRRCAMTQAIILAAPGHEVAEDASASSALTQQRPEWITRMRAWQAMRSPTAERWRQLADALRDEGAFDASAWIARLADESEDLHADQASDASASVALPPQSAIGRVALQADRNAPSSEFWLSDAATPVEWLLPEAGDYMLELRALGNSGGTSWAQLMLAGQSAIAPVQTATETDAIGMIASDGRHAGASLRIPLRVDHAPTSLRIAASSDGQIAARLTGPTTAAAMHAGARVLKTLHTRVDDAQCNGPASRLPLTISVAEMPAATSSDMLSPGTASIASNAVLHGAQPAHASYPEDPMTALIQALWLADRDLPDAASAAGWAMHVSNGLNTPEISAMRNRLRNGFDWQELDSIVYNGGQVLREIGSGHPSDPMMVRRAALAGLDDRALVMYPGRSTALLGLPAGRGLPLQFELRAALPRAELTVDVQGRRLHLSRGESRIMSVIPDDRGVLRIRAGDAPPGSFLVLRAAHADAGTDQLQLRAYHVAPLTIHLQDPTLLLISEWNGRREAQREVWMTAGEHALSPVSLSGAAMRVQAMVRSPARTSSPSESDQPPSSNSTSPQVASLMSPQPFDWRADWPTQGAFVGTWGIGFALQQRRDPDERTTGRERFAEISADYRRQLRRGWFVRSDALLRRHDDGMRSTGLEGRVEWLQPRGPWSARFSLGYWSQDTHGFIGPRPYALHGSARLMYQLQMDDRWTLIADTGLTARHQSMRNPSAAFQGHMDQDVWTRYRQQHPLQPDAGVGVRWRADYRNEWVARLRMLGNAPGHSGWLDQTALSFDWNHAGQRWTGNVGVDLRRRLADGDRRYANSDAGLTTAFARTWMSPRSAWRLRVAAGYDFGVHSATSLVSLEWFRHEGRGVDDALPSELFLRDVQIRDLERPLIPETPSP